MPVFNYIKKLLTSDFFKHSATLLSSNFIAQLIVFLAYPLLTNLYDPTTWGEFSYFITIVAILSTIPTGKYDMAIFLPKSKRKVSALFYLSNMGNVAFLLLSILVLVLCKKPIVSLLGDKSTIIPLLPLIPFLVFLNGIWQPLHQLMLRQKKYAKISSYNLTQSIIGTLAKGLLGWKQIAYSGMIIGQAIGLFFSALVGVLLGRKSVKKLQKPNKADIKEVAREYANFPKYELPNQLITTLSGNLPILMLSAYFDMAEIGLLAFVLAIGLTPVNLFSSSIAQVLLQRMSENKRKDKNIKSECVAFTKMCFFVLLPAFCLLALLPESFFSFVFGEQWAGVTPYFRMLIPHYFFSLVIVSLSFIPDIFLKQKTAFKISIVYLLLKIAALALGIYFHSFALAVALYVIVVVLVSVGRLLWFFRLIDNYENERKKL
jgi:Membrane protein involved in the export of O-antigen and teichoic acid